MLVTNGLLTRTYEERVHAGMRLGRHQVLDARSLGYTIESELAGAALPPRLRPAEHPPAIPVLHQRELASCTCSAGAYHLSALVGAADLAAVSLGGRALSAVDAAAGEAFAAELYRAATAEDGLPWTYPPDDRGSSGLGVCRALRAAGLIDGYVWATSLTGLGALLQRAGAVLGTPWYDAWFQPDADGFVDSDPTWPASGLAGGHEVYVAALESWDDRDPSRSVVRFVNSWGVGWGAGGCGRLRLSTYVALRSQIDVKQYAGVPV